MATEQVALKNNLVVRDVDKTWRWFDAFGDKARKWFFDANAVVSTTTATGCTVTVTNGTLVTADSTTGGAVVLTNAGADNDKVEIQSFSESFYFANKWPAYFGIKFQLVDADQTDVNVGFIVRDTDIAGGVADGIYFRVVDESAALSLVLEKSSAESTTSIGTLADATDYTLEMYYDGDYVYVYLNGALTASVAATDANFCDDEHLTATVAAQAGEAAANNMTVYWARAIQIQEE